MKIDRALFSFALWVAVLGCSSSSPKPESARTFGALGEACDEHHFCAGDLSCISGTCQKDPCIYGSCQKPYSWLNDEPLCLLNPGERTKHRENCVIRDTYDDHGVLRCAALPGSDCSKDSKICGQNGLCVDGVCKIPLGHPGCRDDSDCTEGICREQLNGFLEPRGLPICLIAPGEPAKGPCLISGSTYDDDDGITRCAYPVGSDCSEDKRICGSYLFCSNGICKVQAGTSGKCNEDADCATGSCQKDSIGHQHCFQKPGEIVLYDRLCAYNTYEDNGVKRCSYPPGSDCSKNAKICDERSACIDGICKRELGHGCDSDSDCVSGYCSVYCWIKPGEPANLTEYGSPTDCDDGYYEDEKGVARCAWPLGSDCSQNEVICGDRAECVEGRCRAKKEEMHAGCDCADEEEEICDEDEDCGEGRICRAQDRHCRLMAGYILGDRPDVELCASFAAYEDQGVWKCAALPGSNCSKNSKICGADNVCVKGRCKLALKHYGCTKDSDCAAGICHDGRCLLKPGDPLSQKLDYKSDDDLAAYCTTDDFYTDAHGIRRCASTLGSDCSKDALICGKDRSCIDGICKLNLGVWKPGKRCSADSDCVRGVCTYHGCLLKSGEQTDSDSHCVEYKRTYDDNGTLRCAYPAGSDCSKDARICGDDQEGLQCIDGTCKRRVKLGEICQPEDECMQGDCQSYDESYDVDSDLYCLLDPGEQTTDEHFCVTGHTYEDGDLLRCLSYDCEAYPEHCGEVICKDGRCGPLLGHACQP